MTFNKFALSIATEWIENHESYDKQDCERKAFRRLTEQLKKNYPQLSICITADSLYPNQGFFDICADNNWAFIVTFKDGTIPTLDKEAERVWNSNTNKKQCVDNRIDGKTEISQEFRWVNGLYYHEHKLGWIECLETKTHLSCSWFDVTFLVPQ